MAALSTSVHMGVLAGYAVFSDPHDTEKKTIEARPIQVHYVTKTEVAPDKKHILVPKHQVSVAKPKTRSVLPPLSKSEQDVTTGKKVSHDSDAYVHKHQKRQSQNPTQKSLRDITKQKSNSDTFDKRQALSSEPTLVPLSELAISKAYMPEPDYPIQARRKHETGLVTIHFHLNSLGQPVGVMVNTSSGSKALDDAAVQAVKKWLFPKTLYKKNQVISAPIRFML